jgi:hypothetical protein
MDQDDYEGVQLDFYIPEAIWDHHAIRGFLDRLQYLESGATIFNGLLGVWQGEPEYTRIYRMIRRADQVDYVGMMNTIKADIAGVMAELSTSDASGQQAFMFTESRVLVSLTSLLGKS